MIYLLAIILVLLPIMVKKAGLDDDFYRLLKTFKTFKSLTLNKIKRRVYVVFAFAYAIIALVIFIPGHDTQVIDTQKVPDVAAETTEPKSPSSIEMAKKEAQKVAERLSKEQETAIEFGQLILDMDRFISENSNFRIESYQDKDAKHLVKIVEIFEKSSNASIKEFQERYKDSGATKKSEIETFEKKIKTINDLVSAQISAINGLVKGKYPSVTFNYFVFSNKAECEMYLAEDKASAWTGLACEQDGSFAHVFSRSKVDDGVVKFHVELKSCSAVDCTTHTGKSVNKEFTAASMSYDQILSLFGGDLKASNVPQSEIKAKKERLKAALKQAKLEKAKLEEPTQSADVDMDKKAFTSQDNDVKWFSYSPKDGRRSSINMVVFRDFEHCNRFQDRLAGKLKKQIECDSNKNIKKIKINGEYHEVSGFAYLFKRKSFKFVASYPIFKSATTGRYTYPNGSDVERTGIYIGYLFKNYEDKFMSK